MCLLFFSKVRKNANVSILIISTQYYTQESRPYIKARKRNKKLQIGQEETKVFADGITINIENPMECTKK